MLTGINPGLQGLKAGRLKARAVAANFEIFLVVVRVVSAHESLRERKPAGYLRIPKLISGLGAKCFLTLQFSFPFQTAIFSILVPSQAQFRTTWWVLEASFFCLRVRSRPLHGKSIPMNVREDVRRRFGIEKFLALAVVVDDRRYGVAPPRGMSHRHSGPRND